jgi:hypothetical protein
MKSLRLLNTIQEQGGLKIFKSVSGDAGVRIDE